MDILSTSEQLFIVVILLSVMLLQSLFSVEASEKVTKRNNASLYLTAREAFAMKQKCGDKLLFIDVRTPSELICAGSPINIDENIPLFSVDYTQWTQQKNTYRKVFNTHFSRQVDALISTRNLTKRSPIILLCRSGSLSEQAAELLVSRSYSNLYTVVEGFEGEKAIRGENKGKRVVNGWKNAGLPWEYKLEFCPITEDQLKKSQVSQSEACVK